MKLLTVKHQNTELAGILANDNCFYSFQSLDKNLKPDMLSFLEVGEKAMDGMKNFERKINDGENIAKGIPLNEVEILAPVPRPTSCRDGYAFRQHVESARKNRNVPMIPEFDEYPIFYFTNHNAIQGEGEIFCMPDHFNKLDFELESAIVIGRKGSNIRASEADNYIAGFMIMNDISARTLQMEEMLLNLGPAKGKDFSTVIGPWIVTPDELEKYLIPAQENHTGKNYNLKMSCKVNGITVSEGNMGDMTWTYAEIIERCAYGVDIYPGDVIGSGTVGTGCFLELNGTGLRLNPDTFKPQWLKENDEVEMEISGLGILKNTIRKVDTDYSILSLKKEPLNI